MAGQDAQQPITITNQQGQQITVIPAHQINQIRPPVATATGANIIQMPTMPAIHQFPIQNIPGLGNVQVSCKCFFCSVIVSNFKKDKNEVYKTHILAIKLNHKHFLDT